MLNIMFSLHLLFAIFAIGPLVHAATTASRGIRQRDAKATAYCARMARIYAYVSVLVVIFGFGLMASKEDGRQVAKVSDTWLWLSTLLWLIAVVLVLAVIVPALDKATALISAQESPASLTGRAAAAGGVVGIAFTVIVFLMVYRPGGK